MVQLFLEAFSCAAQFMTFVSSPCFRNRLLLGFLCKYTVYGQMVHSVFILYHLRILYYAISRNDVFFPWIYFHARNLLPVIQQTFSLLNNIFILWTPDYSVSTDSKTYNTMLPTFLHQLWWQRLSINHKEFYLAIVSEFGSLSLLLPSFLGTLSLQCCGKRSDNDHH